MTDQEVIHAFRSDNQKLVSKALRFWEKKYKRMVTNHILKNSGTHQDADYFFNEALYALYFNIKTLDKHYYTAKLSTYFYKILANYWTNELRKRKHIISTESESLDAYLDKLQQFEDSYKRLPKGENFIFESDTNQFRKLDWDDLKRFVAYSKSAIGEKCYKLLRFKYAKIYRYSYEDILKLIPEYKNIDTVKSMAYKCKKQAQEKLYAYYKKTKE